jgi:hypothetical protein
MKKNKEDGLQELLQLLQQNPGLIKDLIFNPEVIASVLHSKKARRLLRGVDPAADSQLFLEYVAGPDDGYPIAQCFARTALLCAKGTKISLPCVSGTKPKPPDCLSGTRGAPD